MTRIGLLGAQGRMGGWVNRLLSSEYGAKAELAIAVDRGDSMEALLLGGVDVVIDFSSPAAMLAVAELALRKGAPLPAFVVGSTGWSAEERGTLEELARKTPVLMSSNFSAGVLALIEILRLVGPKLRKLGYIPVIVETHHRHKKDAPSGTALSLQRAISADAPSSVQTHSLRAGEIVGDHEVTFFGPGDHLTLGHFAQDRSIFARGAIEVALWLATQRQAPGKRGLVSIEEYFAEVTRS